jgi:L-ascorbate metabolism protein UlaG (beta-lactamase superfamily)
VIPADATFRRAEGLTTIVHPCDGFAGATVIAARQGGETSAQLPFDDVRLLSRMSRWATAAELGVPHARLAALVARNCAFFSPARPDRDLTGAPLEPLAGPVALRGNVTPYPVVWLGDPPSVVPLPVMPRMGQLEGVALAGNAFLTKEWDTDLANVLFNCCARHTEMLRDLLPELDGRRAAEDFEGERRALVAGLNDLGLLERHAPRPAARAPSVTWLGHAGVLYEAAGRRLVIDPLVFKRSEPTRHADVPFDFRELGDLDAVLITHGDNDHLHPTALYRVPRTTPIVIPRARAPRPYQVDTRAILALLGFERVIEVDEWERVAFGDVTVVATPFRGEDWDLELPCRTYLVGSRELTIYANADSTSTPEAYEKISAEFEIDVAFLGVTGAAESYAMPPGFGYGDFYTPWIPPAKHNQWIQLCNGPRESAAAAAALRARWAFGYAAGGASFYPLAYTDRGTHAELAAALAAQGAATRPLDLRLGIPWYMGA